MNCVCFESEMTCFNRFGIGKGKYLNDLVGMP